jgi:hypothetical protein
MGKVLPFKSLTPCKIKDDGEETVTGMVCGCGSCSFFLLEGGQVMCWGCDHIITPLSWRDDRDQSPEAP